MHSKADKKVLFVVGIDQSVEPLLQATGVNREHMFVLQTYGPEISHPFSDVMRDIILAVYQENVKDIFVVGTKDDRKNTVDVDALCTKILEREGAQAAVQTMDYLFKNCVPEFTGVDFHEWLKGSKSLMEGIEKSVKILRNHPLLPSDVTVHGLLLETENNKPSEIYV